MVDYMISFVTGVVQAYCLGSTSQFKVPFKDTHRSVQQL